MKKEGKIELYRFLACVFIMIGHYVFYTDKDFSVPFCVAYQFVEFFLLVSGFFTARHFDVKWTGDSKLIDIVKYHLKKFLRFLPFTIPAILGVYVLESYPLLISGDKEGLLNNLKDIVLEMLYLSVFTGHEAHLFIMWFLSAMFITLPFLIAFFLIKNKWVKMIAGFILPVLYYILSPDYAVQESVNQLFRTFFGMMLGGSIYYFSSIVSKKDTPKAVKWVGTVLFLAAYIIPIIISYNNIYLSFEYIICFVLWLTVLMSHLTVLKPWHSKVLGFLGDISMPIFIWHITIFKYVNAFNILTDYPVLRFIISIAVVIIISCLNLLIVRLCETVRKLIAAKINPHFVR